MASRNEVKELLPDAIYHVYNRGVERRPIFMDGHDYRRFLAQLRRWLSQDPSITLLAYCLMPNHFHLLLHQERGEEMPKFMQRLGTGYTRYFNVRHNRIGHLFQGKYKAARVVGPKHLMDESRYIHRNPEQAGLDWRQHAYSSRRDYLSPFRHGGPGPLVDPRPVLDLFDVPGDYWAFLNYRGPTTSENS